MKSNVVKSYAYEMLGQMIDYDGVYGHQCTDISKHFAKEVWKRPLGSFGGSAKSGWENTANTFPESEFTRIENIYGDPNNIPEIGDMIFWATGKYGHVGIVLEANAVSFKCINQNVGNGDGSGVDDAVVITEYNYKNVAGWYRYKKFFAEVNGIPAFIRQEQPSNSMTKNGGFIPSAYGGPYMIFYPHFFTKTEKQQEAIKQHEYAHYVYYEKMSEKERKAWENMSNLPAWAKTKLFTRTGKWYVNGYVSSYAKKSPSEDFSECYEDYILNGFKTYENAYIELKIKTVVETMKKYEA